MRYRLQCEDDSKPFRFEEEYALDVNLEDYH
jgi:hypothetical protein